MLLERGGWVMVPLLVLSVISVTLCLERAWFWLRMHPPGRATLRQIADLTAVLRSGSESPQGKLTGALTRAGSTSVYGRVVQYLLDHGWSESVAVEAVELQRPAMERFMPTLSTIITAAPLLGILGTVSGIIDSFRLLGESQIVTDPRDVSGGIAQALLTTEVGLIIALVTLFPFMIYKAQIDRALSRLEVLIAAGRQGFSKSVGTADREPDAD